MHLDKSLKYILPFIVMSCFNWLFLPISFMYNTWACSSKNKMTIRESLSIWFGHHKRTHSDMEWLELWARHQLRVLTVVTVHRFQLRTKQKRKLFSQQNSTTLHRSWFHFIFELILLLKGTGVEDHYNKRFYFCVSHLAWKRENH